MFGFLGASGKTTKAQVDIIGTTEFILVTFPVLELELGSWKKRGEVKEESNQGIC
jgi:hypothetical protein